MKFSRLSMSWLRNYLSKWSWPRPTKNISFTALTSFFVNWPDVLQATSSNSYKTRSISLFLWSTSLKSDARFHSFFKFSWRLFNSTFLIVSLSNIESSSKTKSFKAKSPCYPLSIFTLEIALKVYKSSGDNYLSVSFDGVFWTIHSSSSVLESCIAVRHSCKYSNSN